MRLVFENKQNALLVQQVRMQLCSTDGMCVRDWGNVWPAMVLETVPTFHTRQVGSGKGTGGRIAEQPVFMGGLLSFTVPVHICHLVPTFGDLHLFLPDVCLFLFIR
jgi:hypothetical protein